MRTCRYLVFLFSLVLAGAPSANERSGSVARAAEETPKDMLAAQVRTQGVICDKPKRAARDALMNDVFLDGTALPRRTRR